MELLDLPRDSLIGIFSELSTRDLIPVARVCKLFYELIKKAQFRFADSYNVVFFGDRGSGKTTLIKNLIKQLCSTGQATFKSIFPSPPNPHHLGALELLDTEPPSKTQPATTIYYLEVKFQNQPAKCIAFIDVPIHPKKKEFKYTSFMADLSLIVVSAAPGDHNDINTRNDIYKEFMLTSYTMGIKDIIVVVNKMDTVQYSQEVYTKIYSDFAAYGKKFTATHTHGVPVSATEEINLTRYSLSPKLNWFMTRSLFAHLAGTIPDKLPFNTNDVQASPLRVCIFKVMNKGSKHTVVAAYVVGGILPRGRQVMILPHGIKTVVEEIRIHEDPTAAAVPGDIVTLLLSVRDPKIDRGSIIASANSKRVQVKKMTAQIVMLASHVNPMKVNGRFSSSFFFHTGQCTCTITSVICKLDKRTGRSIEDSPKFLRNGESALVVIEPLTPFFTDSYAAKLNGKMGRFIFADLNTLVGVGLVKSIDS